MADQGENFQRHVPVHPLPEEIQAMNIDDTICKFCGVSYLIHREIKKLEDRIKVTLIIHNFFYHLQLMLISLLNLFQGA
jgi:hypothetical protein